MDILFLAWRDVLIPIFIIGASLLLGFFAERLIVSRIVKAARLLGRDIDERLVALLKRIVLLVFVAAGVYWALGHYFKRTPHFESFIKTYVSALIILSAIVAARALSTLVDISSKKMGSTFAASSIFTHIVSILVYFVGALMCLSFWGINIAPLLTALGVGGLAVALALQETLSNLFAGINIIVSNKIALGDYVRMEDGIEGMVADISWRNTTIRAANNSTTVVPNAKMASAVVTNYFLSSKELDITVEVGVTYGSDLEHVEKITLGVARESLQNVLGAVMDFEPKVRFVKFGDSGVNFIVTLRVAEYAAQSALRHDFIKRLHSRYRQEGIEIPFRARSAINTKS